MTTKRSVWISRFAIVGVALVGLSGKVARAEMRQEGEISTQAPALTPPERAPNELTAAQAAAKAEQYHQKAAEFRALGGAGYKSGFVRWAEERASHFDAQAALLSTPFVAPSPELAYYQSLARTYRGMGGAAYKAGLVQKAEEAARAYEPQVAVQVPADTALTRHLRFGKAVEAFLTGR